MKITIEFDPGDLAKGTASPVVSVVPGAAASASAPGAAAPGAAGDGATPIDAGHAPGAETAPMATAAVAANGAETIPADIAAKAAAIGALSAGPAPALH